LEQAVQVEDNEEKTIGLATPDIMFSIKNLALLAASLLAPSTLAKFNPTPQTATVFLSESFEIGKFSSVFPTAFAAEVVFDNQRLVSTSRPNPLQKDRREVLTACTFRT